MIAAFAFVVATNLCASNESVDAAHVSGYMASDCGKGLSRSRKYEFGSPAPVTDLLYRLVQVMRAGDDAYDAGNRKAAVADYRRAADFLATIRAPLGYLADAELDLARASYVLGDRPGARRLWTQYLHSSDAPSYRPQMLALRSGDYPRFFALSLDDDPANYALSYPEDNEGPALARLREGLRQGAAGRYGAAQSALQASLDAITHYPTYPLYAWGAAAFARGKKAAALDAWLYASTSGYNGSVDMAYNVHANAAAVTMLLGLSSH